MLTFPHPAVSRQIAEPGPRLSVLFLFMFVPMWLPSLVARGLLLLPSYNRLVSLNPGAYLSTFAAVQVVLIGTAVAILSRRYAGSLWKPRVPFDGRTALCLCLALPLLVYHWLRYEELLSTLHPLVQSPDRRQLFDILHHRVWDPLAYGSGPYGVILSSALSFVAPVLEEMVFSGLLANILARSLPAIVAAIGTSACFALVHVFQFGFGLHLVSVLLSGLIYTLIRFLSGSLLLSIISHLLVNFLIFMPKWTIAWIHFKFAE